MSRGKGELGFTLIELLIGLLVLTAATGAVAGVFRSQQQAQIGFTQRAEVSDNLRMAMDRITDSVREANDRVPQYALSAWIPWVSGFSTSPTLINSGTTDTLRIASCTSMPVATLSAGAAKHPNVDLQLTSAVPGLGISDVLDTGRSRLFAVGAKEFAHVTGVSGSTITIDTDPGQSGNQGFARALPAGTPLCRIDVTSFSIGTDDGRSALFVDDHRGVAAVPFAEGITALDVTEVTAGEVYEVSLSAESRLELPTTGERAEQTLAAQIRLRAGGR